ncbi:B12-binding domain-containing radical SAM protein [Edaphovirga cremea]|uniref:B12-binding domain-containing radical SAM protein n=1 Tax=Edaphovirga cremea TaxID=2267246 RepID=UPI0013006DAA|nr:radical SAM protein [Edaphovirga cremea]
MLRVLAISAPHWEGKGFGSDEHLCSSTPFSLLNAVRGAFKRINMADSAWSTSNWSDDVERFSTIYMSDYEGITLDFLDEKLSSFRPNLVLIGSMTLSTIGAYKVAKLIKEKLGDQVFILLGGKHINETIFFEDGVVKHHISSPIKLMQRGELDNVFDAVASGDCEDLIAEIGEVISHLSMISPNRVNIIPRIYWDVLENAKGDWCLVWLEDNNTQMHLKGTGNLDYSTYPNVYEFYPINTNFKVLGGNKTAHGYSDSSKGCMYSCHFCSESAHVNGKVRNISTSVANLVNTFRKVLEIGRSGTSIFVEDSIFLQASPKGLRDFHTAMKDLGITAKFGCQFTVDNILNPKVGALISELTEIGLNYIFVGLETNNDELASLMSKNRNQKIIYNDKKATWIDKVKLMFEFCEDNNIQLGVSLLFGLGESQEDRRNLLNLIKIWQTNCGYPSVVSMNWAVKHPLRNVDVGNQYKYFDWGFSREDPRTPYLTRLFGEVSDKYNLDGVESMTLDEVIEVSELYSKLTNNI